MISAVVFHLLVFITLPDGRVLARDFGQAGDRAHCQVAMRDFAAKPDIPAGSALTGLWCVAPGTKA